MVALNKQSHRSESHLREVLVGVRGHRSVAKFVARLPCRRGAPHNSPANWARPRCSHLSTSTMHCVSVWRRACCCCLRRCRMRWLDTLFFACISQIVTSPTPISGKGQEAYVAQGMPLLPAALQDARLANAQALLIVT